MVDIVATFPFVGLGAAVVAVFNCTVAIIARFCFGDPPEAGRQNRNQRKSFDFSSPKGWKNQNEGSLHQSIVTAFSPTSTPV